MKLLLVFAVATFAVCSAAPNGDEQPEGFVQIFGKIGHAIRKDFEGHFHAALKGQDYTSTLNEEVSTLAELPLMPYPAYIRFHLDTATWGGLEGFVPDVQIDLIRKRLSVRYQVRQIIARTPHYTFDVAASENFEDWRILKGDGPGSFGITNFDFTATASLNFQWPANWTVNELECSIAPLEVSVNLPNMYAGDLIPVSDLVNSLLEWYLQKELTQFEVRNHEAILQNVRDFLNWLLKGGGLLP